MVSYLPHPNPSIAGVHVLKEALAPSKNEKLHVAIIPAFQSGAKDFQGSQSQVCVYYP